MRTASKIELLEQRRLLAGSVAASLNGAGDLVLTGDNAANNVVVTASATGYSVTGTGTSIKSSIAGAVAIAGGFFVPDETRDLSISLGKGDDSVTIAGVLGDSDVTILTAQGNDDVILAEGSSNAGSIDIDTGQGSDEVKLDSFEFFESTLAVKLGQGSDRVSVARNSFLILSAATIDGGNGGDALVGDSRLGVASSTLDLISVETRSA